MDIETLFYIAIAAIYILSQVLGGKKKKPTPGRTGGPPTRPDRAPRQQQRNETSEMDEALREIRRALGWETPEPEPAPAPPAPPPDRESKPIPPASIEKKQARTIPKARIEQRESAVERARPAKERARRSFERVAPEWVTAQAPEDVEAHLQDQMSEERQRLEAAQRARLERVRKQLRRAGGAQDAFILKEIFDRPHGPRRR